MSLSNFIPAGRTSLVKKGELALQVQTEYAYRPYPRLTTTVLNNGQLLHKIEKKLEKPISSIEERSVMEDKMKVQHSEVVKIIQANNMRLPVVKQKPPPAPPEQPPSAQPELVPEQSQSLINNTPPVKKEITLADKLRDLPGVRYVYQLDMNGNFINRVCSEQFQKAFSALFKSIPELIEIFSLIPGVTITRERGVYEVERDSLYLLSSGTDFYFVLIDNPEKDMNYEQLFKSIVNPSVFQTRS